jgi:hypothetical protein
VLSVLIFREIFSFSTSMAPFLNWLDIYDIRKFNPDFFLLDLCPKIKLCKKIHKTKGKNRSHLIGEKKQKKDQKISVIKM